LQETGWAKHSLWKRQHRGTAEKYQLTNLFHSSVYRYTWWSIK